MTVKDKQTPAPGPTDPAASASSREAAAKEARKEARLSEALRANLAKRKDQARARASGENPADPSAADPPQSAAQNPGKPPRPA